MHLQFSEDSQNNYFFSQPHQPFFVLAFVNAIISMFIFLLSYQGSINFSISPITFHAYGLIYLMFTPAFFGFLFTTFPRFSSTASIKTEIYMRIFTLFYLGSALFLLGSIISPIFSAMAMILIFIGHFMGTLILRNIYKTTSMEDTHDIYWILLAMKFGLVSHLLFIIAKLFYMPLMGLATEIASYLYLFLLTFSVAQRMVPFFSHVMVEKNTKLLKIILSLLILHILLKGTYAPSAFIADFALAYIIGKELWYWKLPFPNPNPLVWILHLALYWIPVAFIFAGLTSLISLMVDTNFLRLDMHLLLLGFVFTILIGFGTRVTIGHSGNIMQADKWIVGLFIWTQVVVLVRLLTSIFSALGWNVIVLFDISVIVWIVMFIAWAVRFFAVLIEGKKLRIK